MKGRTTMKHAARFAALFVVLAGAGVALAEPKTRTMNVAFHNYKDKDGTYTLYLMTPEGKPVGKVNDGDNWGIVLGRNHLTNTSLLNVTFSVEKGEVTIASIEAKLTKEFTVYSRGTDGKREATKLAA